jgi:hypothetical protein
LDDDFFDTGTDTSSSEASRYSIDITIYNSIIQNVSYTISVFERSNIVHPSRFILVTNTNTTPNIQTQIMFRTTPSSREFTNRF